VHLILGGSVFFPDRILLKTLDLLFGLAIFFPGFSPGVDVFPASSSPTSQPAPSSSPGVHVSLGFVFPDVSTGSLFFPGPIVAGTLVLMFDLRGSLVLMMFDLYCLFLLSVACDANLINCCQ